MCIEVIRHIPRGLTHRDVRCRSLSVDRGETIVDGIEVEINASNLVNIDTISWAGIPCVHPHDDLRAAISSIQVDDAISSITSKGVSVSTCRSS